jgi:glycine cleavage system H protein
MERLLYNRDHEWVRAEGKRAVVGISEFAQAELGEVAFVELPQVARRVARGEGICSIDSLKSCSEIGAPVSGTVVQVNESLTGAQGCALINSDPLGAGWLFALEMEHPEELAGLLSPEEYRGYLAEG